MQTATRLSLQEANDLLPLVKAIGREIAERQTTRWRLNNRRHQLEESSTPEGLCRALAELDARIRAQDDALDSSLSELEKLGLTVLRANPLTVHFPGATRSGDVVFCWQLGEESVCYGHPPGEEENPRRPLKLRQEEA